MTGSKTISDRIFLMKNCFKIIFNSNWSKRRFLQDMHNDYINSEKLTVINQSAQKNKVYINNKKKLKFEIDTQSLSRVHAIKEIMKFNFNFCI